MTDLKDKRPEGLDLKSRYENEREELIYELTHNYSDLVRKARIEKYTKVFNAALELVQKDGYVSREAVGPLIEALKFYANEESWHLSDWNKDIVSFDDTELKDIGGEKMRLGGLRAKNALKTWRGEK